MLQDCQSEQLLARPDSTALCLSWKNCVEGRREEAQGCADRTQGHHCYTNANGFHALHVACVRAHGWHVAGAGEVAQGIREEVKRLSGRMMSGRQCDEGCHFRARTGISTGSSRGLQCRYLEFVERYALVRRRDETMICDDSPPRLTLDRDGIGMGNVECVTRAQVWAGSAVLQAA
jgi:hypothetical protein